MRTVLFTILLFLSFISYGQDKIIEKEILKKYQEVLVLNKSQTQEFNKIVSDCNIKLKKYTNLLSEEQKREFNRIVKLQDYSIYKILNIKQFESYKELKNQIESSKKYKF